MKKTTRDDAPANGERPGHTWESSMATRDVDMRPPAAGGGAERVPDSRGPRGLRGTGRLTGSQAFALALLAVVLVLVGTGAGVAGALAWPKTYAARAEMLFPLTEEQPTGFLREDRNMTTQLVLIAGRPVLLPVAAQLGRTVTDLQSHVTASVLQSSEIIQVQVTDGSQARAVQTTQAVVDSYLRVNQTNEPLLRQRLDTQLGAATTALTQAQARLSAGQNAVAAGTAAPESIPPLQTAVQTAQTRQQQLQSQLQGVNQANANPIAQLITPAYPAGVVSPSTGFAATAGALVGLLLAVGVVAVVARSWTRE